MGLNSTIKDNAICCCFWSIKIQLRV